MKFDNLETQTVEFWRAASNAKIEYALLCKILKEVRAYDCTEAPETKFNRLAKMQAWLEMIDLEAVFGKAQEIMSTDDEILAQDY